MQRWDFGELGKVEVQLHSPSTRGEDGAHQQDLGILPDALGEQ